MITGSDARIHVGNVNDPFRASMPIYFTTALEMPRLAYEQSVAKHGLEYALVSGVLLHRITAGQLLSSYEKHGSCIRYKSIVYRGAF